MRILFMGTPGFAVPCLEKLIADGHEVCGVFTQPDKPRGRGLLLCPTPVKEAALRSGIAVYQPEGFKNVQSVKIITSFNPQVIVVVAYGRILPETVLNIPALGCINVHASLLPKYRGAAPIQRAVIDGEEVTGLATMYMAKGLDTGDIILSEELLIGQNETFGELQDRMMLLGANLLSKTLELIESGNAPRIVQDDAAFTYAKMIEKADCIIDFKKSAQQVHNLVRGLSPSPSANTIICGIVLKVHKTEITPLKSDKPAGIVIKADADGIFVKCGDGTVIKFTQVQALGGKRMAAADYLRGHSIKEGCRFGG